MNVVELPKMLYQDVLPSREEMPGGRGVEEKGSGKREAGKALKGRKLTA